MKITAKVTTTFSFYRLAKYIGSANYNRMKSKATFTPLVDEYKKFIKKGKVKPQLKNITINNRKRRKTPPSIGGSKPLYDTGKLAKSLRYDEGKRAVVGIDYAKAHIEGFKNVPARNFIEQYEKITSDKKMTKLEASNLKPLTNQIREVFRKRLAK